MPNQPAPGSAEWYRDQARRARELISTMLPKDICLEFEAIARQYDEMAENAEVRKKLGR